VDPWDTWEVGVLGGEPRVMLRNASSLTWIEGGKRLLFSEIKSGLHMGVVTTDEGRGEKRDVYLPVGERSMAHHAYLSPDGRWVLVVLMNGLGKLIQCRVVPFDGSGTERLVGPKDAVCTTGAWSPDGKWVYVSANAGGAFHIWRQRFPDGEPEELTAGPTEEEGIAMASDGKSFITSVGTKDSTIWVHDRKGDRQLSSEGAAFATTFSKDGTRLYYLKWSGQEGNAELWRTELASGVSERVLKGYGVEVELTSKNYAISDDGKRVAFVNKDEKGISRLWIAPTDGRSSPERLESNATESEDSPAFLPNGDVIYRASRGGNNYLCTKKVDGSGEKKVVEEPILDFTAISPDGKWAMVGKSLGKSEEETAELVAQPVEGGASVPLCRTLCIGGWDLSRTHMYLSFLVGQDGKTYFMPLEKGQELPKVLAKGPVVGEELKGLSGVSVTGEEVESAMTPEVYSYSRKSTRRNLYRIPVP